MVDATHKSYNAADRSYYAILKKDIHALALNMGFAETRIAELDIVVAEMTSNLYKYANGGELLVGAFVDVANPYLELICIDDGPGMADLNRMLSDGYSSSNTIGHGFGSMKRLSDQFDVFSLKGWGTLVLSRIYINPLPKTTVKKGVLLRPIVVSKPGETTSGDGFYMKTVGDNVKLILCDGLGHGPEANLAINEAVKAFKQCTENSPVQILRYLHSAVRKTRGMVATVVVFDMVAKQLSLAGVGNIATKLAGPVQVKNHLAYNGIVGHNIPNTMNDAQVKFSEYNQVIMCSDGIRSRWDLSKHPGLSRCDPSLQAAAIYKEFARKTDDMSVLIAKM